MKPYFDENGITIYCGDNREILPALPAESVDMAFTSPPYNLGNTTGGGFVKQLGGMAYQRTHYSPETPLGKRGGVGKWSGGSLAYGYEDYSDALPHDEYVAWQNEFLRSCWNLLTPKGAVFYNHKPRVLGGRLIAPIDYVPDDLRGFVRQEIIWARAGGINFSPSFYCPTHERIVVIARPEWRLRDKAASGAGDVWYIPQESDNEHPAPFPVELPRRAIETTPAEIILDPFMGSGSTGMACAIEGRRFIGIELKEKYCELAVARIKRAKGIACDIPKLKQSDAVPPLFAGTFSGERT